MKFTQVLAPTEFSQHYELARDYVTKATFFLLHNELNIATRHETARNTTLLFHSYNYIGGLKYLSIWCVDV